MRQHTITSLQSFAATYEYTHVDGIITLIKWSGQLLKHGELLAHLPCSGTTVTGKC